MKYVSNLSHPDRIVGDGQNPGDKIPNKEFVRLYESIPEATIRKWDEDLINEWGGPGVSQQQVRTWYEGKMLCLKAPLVGGRVGDFERRGGYGCEYAGEELAAFHKLLRKKTRENAPRPPLLVEPAVPVMMSKYPPLPSEESVLIILCIFFAITVLYEPWQRPDP